MLPKNTLRDRRMERLKIFEADEVERGLGGNLTSSWGSLIESRGLVAGERGESSSALLGSTDWTKPLPVSMRSTKAIKRRSTGARVVHSTKVKTTMPKPPRGDKSLGQLKDEAETSVAS